MAAGRCAVPGVLFDSLQNHLGDRDGVAAGGAVDARRAGRRESRARNRAALPGSRCTAGDSCSRANEQLVEQMLFPIRALVGRKLDRRGTRAAARPRAGCTTVASCVAKLIDALPRDVKIVIVRCCWKLTREAESWATQPLANVSRAVAMSSWPPSTEMPSACTSLDRRLGERQHDVQVVDHHVQHDADVGRAKRVAARARGFDVFRIADVGRHGGQRRIEPLDVADLQHQRLSCRASATRSFGLGRRRRERLFDQAAACRRSSRSMPIAWCVAVGVAMIAASISPISSR